MDRSNRYFQELTLHLTRQGFAVQKEQDGLLPVELDGAPLCRITEKGVVRYWPEEQDEARTSLIRGKVTDIARTVSEYTRLMESAPYLEASSLDSKFKLLADFNGTVLAARNTQFGAQFVTWYWNDDRTAVYHGNYFSSYEGAKQDFAVRAGLVERQRLFSDAQLTEAYRCIQEVLDSDCTMTYQRESVLKDTAEQIQRAVPDLEERVTLANQQELEQQSGGMTQQF